VYFSLFVGNYGRRNYFGGFANKSEKVVSPQKEQSLIEKEVDY
jgi:hypothetical protein